MVLSGSPVPVAEAESKGLSSRHLQRAPGAREFQRQWLDTDGRNSQRIRMRTEPPIVDSEKLMADVGRVLLHWCYLEDALTEAIRRLRIESEGAANLIRVRGSFSDRLSEWRGLLSQKTRRNPQMAETVADQANEIEHLRATRNLIAHHLAGADASPDEGQSYIWCEERGAPSASIEPKRITLADLGEMIEAMDRCRYRFRAIG